MADMRREKQMPSLRWPVTALERNPAKLVSEAMEDALKEILNCFADARRWLWRRCKPLTVQWLLYGSNIVRRVRRLRAGKSTIAYESSIQVVGAVPSELGGRQIVVGLSERTAVWPATVSRMAQESTCSVVCPLAPRC